MNDRVTRYLKRNIGWMTAVAAIAAYVVISGKTGSCPTCSAITQIAGIIPAREVADPQDFKQLKEEDHIPDGVLYSSDGEPVDMLERISHRPTVLVFYRGGWCPFCNRHLSAIVDIMPELEAMGVELVAISPDRPEMLKAKPALANLPYTLLSDSQMNWTSSFGIAFKVPENLIEKYKSSYNIDIEADSGQNHHLLPHPSVFVIGRDGVIRFSHVNENYKVRLEPEKIVAAARGALK